MQDLYDAEGDELPTPKYTRRDCLHCKKKFKSFHKFNRICRKCNLLIESKPFREGKDLYSHPDNEAPSEWPLL